MRIGSDREYREAAERLEDLRRRVHGIRDDLARRGLDGDAVRLATAPQEAMADDIASEIELYQRLKAGDSTAVPRYASDERGKALVCLRIVKGWSQRQLAEALGVSEAVVSRDERNDYRGISLEQYGKVVHALGFGDGPRFGARPASQPPVEASRLPDGS
jgi:Helix-turn-helix